MKSVRHTFLLCVLLLAPMSAARAHRFEHPRQLRVGVSADRIVVSMTYDLDPGERSRTARQLFDRNTDGQLDETERGLLESWMERTALRFLRVSFQRPGAEPVTLELETAKRAGHRIDLPSSSTENLGMSLLLTAPIPPAPAGFVLVVQDQEVDRQKHVPLVLDLAPGLALRFASQGEWHSGTRQLQRVGLTEARALKLDLTLGEVPPKRPSSSFSGCLP